MMIIFKLNIRLDRNYLMYSRETDVTYEAYANLYS